MKSVTKWMAALGFGLGVGSSAFAQNLRCERFEYDRSLTKVTLRAVGDEVNFSLERNGRSDGGFFAAAAAVLNLSLEKNDDVYKVALRSVGPRATLVGANPLLGFITLWHANTPVFEAALTRTTAAGGEQRYPLNAGYFHLNTEKVTRESVHSSFSQIVVAMNMAVMPWTNFIESIPFSDGECRAN